jgi:signal transduction histidine kinase
MEATRVRTLDIVLAPLVAAALVAASVGIERDASNRSFDALAVVLIVAATGVLVIRRRASMVALAVTTATLVIYGLREYPGGPIYFTWIAAVFAVSVSRGPARAWVPVTASTAVVVVSGLYRAGLVAALFVSWAVGALLLAGSVRGRRAERAVMDERARHLAETREEEARRRVAEERVRIARDLHDSVAHSLTGISVQAGVGAHVLDERPDDALAALLAIKRASGDALADLRATLSMLRSSEAAPREPTAGLDRLPSLVESSRAAGLPVDVVIEGPARPLPPAVDAAAFRIVQESLTNVIRHADAARAVVAVRHREGCVEIEVTDDGRGVVTGGGADGGGGHGLAGMQERAALLGGELDAGTRPSGGFRVRARLPL